MISEFLIWCHKNLEDEWVPVTTGLMPIRLQSVLLHIENVSLQKRNRFILGSGLVSRNLILGHVLHHNLSKICGCLTHARHWAYEQCRGEVLRSATLQKRELWSDGGLAGCEKATGLGDRNWKQKLSATIHSAPDQIHKTSFHFISTLVGIRCPDWH